MTFCENSLVLKGYRRFAGIGCRTPTSRKPHTGACRNRGKAVVAPPGTYKTKKKLRVKLADGKARTNRAATPVSITPTEYSQQDTDCCKLAGICCRLELQHRPNSEHVEISRTVPPDRSSAGPPNFAATAYGLSNSFRSSLSTNLNSTTSISVTTFPSRFAICLRATGMPSRS